jgi:hypothetical protein
VVRKERPETRRRRKRRRLPRASSLRICRCCSQVRELLFDSNFDGRPSLFVGDRATEGAMGKRGRREGGRPKSEMFFLSFFSSFDDAFDESVVDVSGLEIRRRTEKNPNLS